VASLGWDGGPGQSRTARLAGKRYLRDSCGTGAGRGARKHGRRRAAFSPHDLRDVAAPKTAADLRELLAESIIEIRAGKLDPIANALGYHGASYLPALEASDIKKRLVALEGTQQAQERAIPQSHQGDCKHEGEV
jgi:hypothetical protein